MNSDEKRSEAWNKSLYAEATRAVFQARSRRLSWKTRARDFVGLAVPIFVAYILGADSIDALKDYRHLIIQLLALLAALQIVFTLWSLIARWDDELAYSKRAARDSHDLVQAWEEIAKGSEAKLEAEFDLLARQQAITDSHDSERQITLKERQYGMRAGLILRQKNCICGYLPTSFNVPGNVTKKCAVCGGN